MSVVNNMMTIRASAGRITFRYNFCGCSRCTLYCGCKCTLVHQPRWPAYTRKDFTSHYYTNNLTIKGSKKKWTCSWLQWGLLTFRPISMDDMVSPRTVNVLEVAMKTNKIPQFSG